MNQKRLGGIRSNVLPALALMGGALWLLAVGPVARAQVVNATVLGTVKDTSGSVVPNATVVVTNTQTGVSRSVVADTAGDYAVRALLPGAYTVSAEFQGFKKTVLTGITLNVDQEARIDITLSPGPLVQTVEVKSSAPLINTEDSTIGAIVNERQMVDLPLDGRDFMQLTLLSQGVNGGSDTVASAGIIQRGLAPSAAGSDGTENNYQLDGSSNTELFFHSFNVAPSVDAVQEFKMQVGMYSAEFGGGAEP